MPSANYTIRQLAESDLQEWLRLRLSLWDEFDEDDQMSEMADIIENQEYQLVAVADSGGGQLVGFLEASIRSHVEDCDTDRVGYLEGWFVDEANRQTGIGRELVRFAEQWAVQKGCTEMASDAEVGNVVSQQAHARLGYQETSRLVHFRKELRS